ncbi:NADH:flavin oxidoreductase/NADH oxidase [Bdellovibrio sp. SKB1291214]|uniref:NADH:flavin oxidoreductase/NADH oxidase n=1 Tax=Bdellovibrio sp. SKB1291214 TaxID=1732569 RepID=UPI002240BDC2|nr:NADH:flavin oxidoreductase/NADH oxidase [Bdellovibrio sp. SKB1291214]UYL07318.1 NADH:flavin oxidoreductase/NADH oxidase [Bdellovibrio sp. SKB1291214]
MNQTRLFSPLKLRSIVFSPLKLRSIELKNRIAIAPMCMYSATDGVPNNWHLVHLGSRAVGGAGLVVVEATGVRADGRISPGCLGLWNEEQLRNFQPITEFIKRNGTVAGIQLAHAGRKSSTDLAWKGGKPLGMDQGAWETVGPSPLPFAEGWPTPRELTIPEIKQLVTDYVHSTRLAEKAGFQVIELHMAHGYLMHEFLSPISNQRTDQYGGSLENRMRFPLEVAAEVRKAWPAELPLFVRISATDWLDNGGWDLEQSISFAKELKKRGVDLVDCSSGGNVPKAKIPVGPGYQVPFAEGVRKEAEILTGAVGKITEALQAEEILQSGKADLILIARSSLHDPYWPLHAAEKLGVDVTWPLQYGRVHT